MLRWDGTFHFVLLCTHVLFEGFLNIGLIMLFIIFMYMGVCLVCTYAWFPRKPEGGIGALGTGITDS